MATQAICKGCGSSAPLGRTLPTSCADCGCPFFWYYRVPRPVVEFTEADRDVLASGGIAAA